MNKPLSTYLAPLGVFMFFAGGGIFFLSSILVPPLPANAEDVVALCENKDFPERCYEKAIPEMYPRKSIPEIFDIIRDVRHLDSSYQFCHVLAHKLGELVVAEDHDAWLDAIPLNPQDGLCSNGFIHGVIVGRFRNDVLDEAALAATIPEFRIACEPRGEWKASPLDQAICYHGLGHLFMFITNADIERALDACRAIGISPTGNFLRVCQEGVFMQIYQPLEPDDFALIELLPEQPSAENYRRMCDFYGRDSEEKGACLREAWPLFRDDIVTGQGVAAFCSGQPNADETEKCFQTSSAIVGRMSLGGSNAASAACTAFPSAWRSVCFVSVAQTILEENRAEATPAIAFCHTAPVPLQEQCLLDLVERASYIFGTDSAYTADFCAELPLEIRFRCNE